MNKFFKKLISGATVLTLICTALNGYVFAEGDYSGGSGTEASPYLISSVADLQELADNVNGGEAYSGKYFKLTNDITLTGEWTSIGDSEQWKSDTTYGNFVSEGTPENSFSGVFDGDGHKISGFKQTKTTSYKESTGLFGSIRGGTVKNLTLNGVIDIKGGGGDDWTYRRVGTIVSALSDSALIDNCTYEGSITIRELVNDSSKNLFIGGIAGYNYSSTINHCFNHATIDSYNYSDFIGGIAGYQDSNGLIKNSGNTGNMTGDQLCTEVLSGIAYNGIITNCFNTGTLISWSYHVASISHSGTVSNCFNTGDLTGGGTIGPILASGTATNSYYLTETVSAASDDEVELLAGTVHDDGAIAKTAEQFASGEVAYLLNEGSSSSDVAWHQTLGSDGIPTLDATHDIVFMNDDGSYTNTDPSGSVTINTNRKLYVEYMGHSTDENAPYNTSPGKAQFTTDDVDDTDKFWIGVSVDKIQDLPLFTDGIYSFEVAFEYDPSYVEPWYDPSSTNATNRNADWLKALKDANLTTENNAAWWNADQYDILCNYRTNINDTVDREGHGTLAQTRAAAGWKMCTVCISFKEGLTFENARYKGWTSEDKTCLIKIPFKLTGAPADDAADANPTVLSLVRGPSTLDIGSDENGVNPYSAWEATVTDPDDATNMKTLFTFNGDVTLFGSGSSLEGIKIYKAHLAEDEAETEYNMYHTSALADYGFNAETKTYYTSVPYETEYIKLDISSSSAPTVKANGTDINAPPDSATDKLYSAEVKLNTMNKEVEANGFSNTITVTIGSDVYTIYVRRCLKPRIELEYGNSPAGLIKRDPNFTDAEKEQALEDFDEEPMNKKYNPDLVPENGEASLSYTTKAWNSYTVKDEDGQVVTDESGNNVIINYDLDEYALFVYQATNFKDPGLKVYDEMGDLVPSSDITINRTINLKQQTKTGASNYNNDSGVTDYEPALVEDSTDTYILSGIMIRTDVYKIEYSCSYVASDGSVIELEGERPLIILGKRGDISLSSFPTVNIEDVDYMAGHRVALDTGNSLLAYRCADVKYSTSPTVNIEDVDYMAGHRTDIDTSTVQYYKALN